MKEEKMARKVNSINSVTPSQVYAGGALTPISVADLKGNEVAINQLLNHHNIIQQELNEERSKNQYYETELTISNISPFVAVISAVINIIGTILIAVGTSLDRENLEWLFWMLIITGAVCLLSANIATIFYKPISRLLAKQK